MGDWHSHKHEDESIRELKRREDARDRGDSSHPFLAQRHKPSTDPQRFIARIGHNFETGNKDVDLQRLDMPSLNWSIPIEEMELNGKPGVWIGCTWFSTELVNMVHAKLNPKPVEAVRAKVVTKLPRYQPRKKVGPDL